MHHLMKSTGLVIKMDSYSISTYSLHYIVWFWQYDKKCGDSDPDSDWHNDLSPSVKYVGYICAGIHIKDVSHYAHDLLTNKSIYCCFPLVKAGALH